MMYGLEKIVHPKRQKEELNIAKIKIYKFFRKILYRDRPSLFSLLIRFGNYIKRNSLVYSLIAFGFFFCHLIDKRRKTK